MSRPRSAPIRTFLEPRVEIYAPTASFPYYRVAGYDRDDKRVISTSGGTTIRSAKAKAAQVAGQLRRKTGPDRRDPLKTLVSTEVELWLDPANHRSRGNKPWSQRHADNMNREWELRVAPLLPSRATVWRGSSTGLRAVDVLTRASRAAGLSPEDEAVIVLTRVAGVQVKELAACWGVPSSRLRQRRLRWECRLREAIATGA